MRVTRPTARIACRTSTRRAAFAAGTVATVALALSGSALASADVRHQPGPPAAAATETFGYVGPQAQTTVMPGGTGSAQVRVIGAMGGSTFTAQSAPATVTFNVG
jgi:hypothetical protein